MQQGCNKGRNNRGTTQIQARVTARSLQTSNKVLTDNAVRRPALMIHAENSGMSYTYKPSRCLTPTGSSLCRSVLYLVPVTVFKGLFNCLYYYICACGKCQGKFYSVLEDSVVFLVICRRMGVRLTRAAIRQTANPAASRIERTMDIMKGER